MLGCAETIQKIKQQFSADFAFLLFHGCGVSRGVLGPHFGGFGITWGTILVILEVPGEVLKFDWILGSPLGHPRLREVTSWVVNCHSVGHTNHQSQIADPQPADS